MTHDAFGLIYTAENSMSLKDLTMTRSVAAVPVAGRYRCIDFLLSNLVNTGIRNVGVIAQKNYHSLMDHLGSGKEWELDRKRDGLFILPPFVTRDNTGIYKGTLDALKSVMGYIRRSSQRYCVLMGSHTLYNTTYDEAIEFHQSVGADITMLYNEEAFDEQVDTERGSSDDIYLFLERNGRVSDMQINPSRPISPMRGMDAFIAEKTLLEYLVEDAAGRGQYDMIRDLIQKNLSELRVFGFAFPGYVARLDSVMSYYKHNLAMLKPEVRQDLFTRGGPVYTKIKDEVPAHYGDNALAMNSMVADGCVVEGQVENSMLFRGVYVGKGAQVRDSILMQNVEVQDGAVLEHVILDKGVTIKRDRRLTGQSNFPIVIRKNAVI